MTAGKRRGNYVYSPRPHCAGENNHRTILEQEDYALIMGLLDDGLSIETVAEKFEISVGTIIRIIRGNHWLCRGKA